MNDQMPVQPANDDVMTLSQIAKYLTTSESAVLRIAESGDLPGEKTSSQWRFQKTVIDNWLTGKIQAIGNDELLNMLETKSPIIPIPRLVSDNSIIMDVRPGTKREVLTQLVRSLLASSAVSDPAKFLVDLLDREEMVSTALTDGVAIPHVRDQETSGVKETCIVLGICKEGTDFEALDGEKTHLFFLLCAQSTSSHLRLLSKLTIMLRQPGIITRFCACETTQDVMHVLMDAHFNLSVQL